MIGAGGAVGGTVALGIAALSKGIVGATGLVTARPEFVGLGLIEPGRILVGGHEIRSVTFIEAARALQRSSNVIPQRVLGESSPMLEEMQSRVKRGIVCGHDSPLGLMEAVRRDLAAFRSANGLDHVVVVNVASTERPIDAHPAHGDWESLGAAMGRADSDVIPVSAIYALGAFAAGCSYINFTPSVGMNLPAIEEFAGQRDVLFMGRDGKTGETLLKTVLAPMFASRNLRVRSWVGHNVLGNEDGRTLSDPTVKASKLRSKNTVLANVLGYEPHTCTTIEYVPSLGDWKTAWDLIHFEGFLGTPMRLEFTWTGSDSMLAAPLIIDLVRLTALERTRGRRGRMEHLACFFKDPDGVREHDHHRQWNELINHVKSSGTVLQ